MRSTHAGGLHSLSASRRTNWTEFFNPASTSSRSAPQSPHPPATGRSRIAGTDLERHLGMRREQWLTPTPALHPSTHERTLVKVKCLECIPSYPTSNELETSGRRTIETTINTPHIVGRRRRRHTSVPACSIAGGSGSLGESRALTPIVAPHIQRLPRTPPNHQTSTGAP